MPDKIRINTDIRNTDVVNDIAQAIGDGIRESVSSSRRRSLGHRMRRAAQQQIADEGRVWSGELIESFSVESNLTPEQAVIRLSNDAAHAAAVDEGAEYGDEGPPLHELIPWVITNMQHTQVDSSGNLVPRDG